MELQLNKAVFVGSSKVFINSVYKYFKSMDKTVLANFLRLS